MATKQDQFVKILVHCDVARALRKLEGTKFSVKHECWVDERQYLQIPKQHEEQAKPVMKPKWDKKAKLHYIDKPTTAIKNLIFILGWNRKSPKIPLSTK